MRKSLAVLIMIFAIAIAPVRAQVKYMGKIEAGYAKYLKQELRVEPGPGWQGYNLKGEPNGVDVNVINGISFARVSTGIGIGYLNYEGTHGATTFGEVEYLPLRSKLSPIAAIRLGYTHVWNQYENGKTTGMLEFNGGLNYNISQNVALYAKGGILFTQQSSFFPVRVGIRF